MMIVIVMVIVLLVQLRHILRIRNKAKRAKQRKKASNTHLCDKGDAGEGAAWLENAELYIESPHQHA
jgi:hypothetical protein